MAARAEKERCKALKLSKTRVDIGRAVFVCVVCCSVSRRKKMSVQSVCIHTSYV